VTRGGPAPHQSFETETGAYQIIFTETKLAGAYLIEPELLRDERGFFSRMWCQQEFAVRGLRAGFVQGNLSYSARAGTLRGMHYQVAPDAEVKLVRCTRGSIYDVIVDLRPASPTYRDWSGAELSAANYRMLYVPEGFAHGFQTLEDETEVSYEVSQFYRPGSEQGLRYDDPAFGIAWPIGVTVVSEKDRSWSTFGVKEA
jgi:dTDP-4-dehydrorhamnose 3,5-epimerase